MLKYAQLFLVGCITLLTASTFAESFPKSQQITPLAGPCVHLRTPYQCVNYPTGECFWDDADQRCESYNDNEDRCSRIRSPGRCLNSPYGCFWDYDDQRCERRD